MEYRNRNLIRCVARKEIRTRDGIIRAFTKGIILGETENVGRRLLSVRWETGMQSYVFPSEVDFLNSESQTNGK
ncbi:MAG: hypothetical protein ACM3TN_05280 [Alphaproteobacteria bacterium]